MTDLASQVSSFLDWFEDCSWWDGKEEVDCTEWYWDGEDEYPVQCGDCEYCRAEKRIDALRKTIKKTIKEKV